MICYRDRTWCEFNDCKHWKNCCSALTKNVQRAADLWWEGFNSKDGVPISIYVDKPECFSLKK